jgi:hypothetical protein
MTTMNIHHVNRIEVDQKKWIAAPGDATYPNGLVVTLIVIHSDEGELEITAFNNESGEMIPMERS